MSTPTHSCGVWLTLPLTLFPHSRAWAYAQRGTFLQQKGKLGAEGSRNVSICSRTGATRDGVGMAKDRQSMWPIWPSRLCTSIFWTSRAQWRRSCLSSHSTSHAVVRVFQSTIPLILPTQPLSRSTSQHCAGLELCMCIAAENVSRWRSEGYVQIRLFTVFHHGCSWTNLSLQVVLSFFFFHTILR